MSQPEKLGLLGGAFDPFHLGHLQMAIEARQQLQLDRVLLIPTFVAAHKQTAVFPFDQRVEMLKSATAQLPWLDVCDLEASLPQPSYTYRTLLALQEVYPEAEMTLILGADAFQGFKHWYEWQKLQRLCKIAVFPRDNQTSVQFSDSQDTSESLDTEVSWLTTPGWPVSSTQIRQALNANMSATDLQHQLQQWLPAEVITWIMSRTQM